MDHLAEEQQGGGPDPRNLSGFDYEYQRDRQRNIKVEIATAQKRVRLSGIVLLLLIFCLIPTMVLVLILSAYGVTSHWTNDPAQASVIPQMAGLMLLLAIVGASSIPLRNYLQWGRFFVRQSEIQRLVLSDMALNDDRFAPGLANAGNPSNSQEQIASFEQIFSPEERIHAQVMETSRGRLNQEITALRRRAETNLIIGVATTTIGVGVLGYIVFFQADPTGDHWAYVGKLVMRLSIAVFIEVFAYFFLRLYKNTLEDIRFYQNEITNIEAKASAVAIALAAKETGFLKAAIESLSKTERNFLLKKGESTVGLERERMDKNELLDLVRVTAASLKGKEK